MVSLLCVGYCRFGITATATQEEKVVSTLILLIMEAAVFGGFVLESIEG